MVGIVVVAHSRPLARAAVDFARQMVHGEPVPVAVAAGVDENTYGTDAVAIQAAIEEVAGPDGVLVLMDLGSAVLSTELALDLVDPQIRSQVVVCSAPLVEGLVVAMVAASGGATAADVAAEASNALAGKQAHLASSGEASDQSAQSAAESPEPAAESEQATEPVASVPAPRPSSDDHAAAAGAPGAAKPARVTDVFVLGNEHGLHARPAARLVADVRKLDAQVTLRNLSTGAGPVPANSLSRVATLGAVRGHRIEVAAEGGQAREAVDHVLALAARNFDEEPSGAPGPGVPQASVGQSTPKAGTAREPGTPLPAVPGVVVGPVWRPDVGEVEVPDTVAADPAAEWRRLRTAVAEVRQETARLRARTAQDVGEAEAAIFDAHLMLLDDADLLDQVRADIDAGRTAEAGWADALRRLADEMAELADPYQRARAADVRAVRDQVLRSLLGVTARIDSQDGVLVAPDLTPAEVSSLDPAVVRGIVLGYGSPTAHSAIIARTRGIPMLVAAGPEVLDVPDGTTVAFDGGTGELVIDPDPDTLRRYRERAEARRRAEAQARAVAAEPARTTDGVPIDVEANLGSLADAEHAASSGADGAGLVRTEFLFLDRSTAPDVDEQEAAYRGLAEAMPGRRLTVRTLDVGGDKPLPYLPADTEANPFLGRRGIRLSLAREDLLRDQLTAICRVARDTSVSVMFPMVSTVDELIAALKVLDTAATDVAPEGRPPHLRVGIMVEVPAAALKAAAFAPYVDFFSIGTNDLTQYALAAERGNDTVARLADPLDPAVLRLIDLTCRAAEDRLDVAVCGDLAADEDAVGLLIGLGVRTLSVAPAAVPMVKQAVRRVDADAAGQLAQRALDAPSAEAVRALIDSHDRP